MLVFHRKPIPIIPTKLIPEFGAFMSIFDYVIPDEKGRLNEISKFFEKNENKYFTMDTHLIDVICPQLNHPIAFSVYLMMFRLSDQNIYIGTIEHLMQKLNLNRKYILEALSILEENLLIKINGVYLLKIEINTNWY